MLIKAIVFLCFFGKILALSCAPPEVFSAQKTSGIKIATNASGEAVALWIAEEKEGEAIYASSKAGNTAWTAPERISPVMPDIVRPRITMDVHGNIFASWVLEILDEESLLQVCEKPHGFAWGKPETISSSGGYIQLEDGHLTSAWESVGRWSPDFSTSSKAILHAKKPLLQTVEWDYLAQTCCSSYTDIAVASNAEGTLFAVWERRTADGQHVLEYAWRRSGTPWTPLEPIPVMASSRNWHMQVVIDSQENVTLVGRSPRGGKLMVISRSYGVWSEPVFLTQEDEKASSCKLTIDEVGNAFIVWTRKSGHKEVLCASYKPVGKEWTLSTTISSEEYDCCCYDAKPDYKGHFIACWGQTVKDTVAIHGASFSTKEQKWSASELLSPEGVSCWSPSLAFSEGGASFLGWVTEDSIQIAELRE